MTRRGRCGAAVPAAGTTLTSVERKRPSTSAPFRLDLEPALSADPDQRERVIEALIDLLDRADRKRVG